MDCLAPNIVFSSYKFYLHFCYFVKPSACHYFCLDLNLYLLKHFLKIRDTMLIEIFISILTQFGLTIQNHIDNTVI